MRVLVPMQDKPNGIHRGHEALIAFGKTMGDVTIAIHHDLGMWNNFLLRGHSQEEKQKLTLTRMETDITRLKVSSRHYDSNLYKFDESERLKLFKEAEKIVEKYRNDLLLERYINMAISMLIRTRLREINRTRKPPSYVVVRGPEILGFFARKVAKELNWAEQVIFPEIVRDEVSGIKLQSGLEKMSPQRLRGIRKKIKEASKFYAVGLNEKLVTELNASYQGEDWIAHDIAVWEGGMVLGRIEAVGFSVKSGDGKWHFFEEVEYYE